MDSIQHNSLRAMIVAVASAIVMTACIGSSASKTGSLDSGMMVSVDSLLFSPDQYVGKVISLTGICNRLGRVPGKRVYLSDSCDSLYLRCDATSLLPGGCYPDSVLGHKVKIKGIVHEHRIDEIYLREMENAYNARRDRLDVDEFALFNAGINTLDAVKKGYPGIVIKSTNPDSVMKARLDDYRSRIAAREASDGKDYVSYYYIDAIDYEVE